MVLALCGEQLARFPSSCSPRTEISVAKSGSKEITSFLFFVCGPVARHVALSKNGVATRTSGLLGLPFNGAACRSRVFAFTLGKGGCGHFLRASLEEFQSRLL